MMGSGIIMLPSNLAEFGGISIVSWLVTAVGSMCLAYAFSKCGMFSKKSGGMTGYAEYSFGKAGNFLCNYVYSVSILVSNVAIAISSSLEQAASRLKGIKKSSNKYILLIVFNLIYKRGKRTEIQIYPSNHLYLRYQFSVRERHLFQETLILHYHCLSGFGIIDCRCHLFQCQFRQSNPVTSGSCRQYFKPDISKCFIRRNSVRHI